MPNDPPNNALIRVPEITLYFWIVKILTTGAGESISDALAHISPIVAAAVGGLGFVIALFLQFRMKRYVAWAYWLAALMVAVFGTMAADVVHDALHVGYLESSLGFAVALVVIFALWYRSERTLSIHSITTRGREWFYWATVIATFALGTAVGDMTATTFNWGYLDSGFVFGVAFLAVGGIHFLGRRHAQRDAAEQPRETPFTVFSFWFAYVLTRPLGASFADWMGKPRERDGLGFGDGTVGIALLVLIVIVVGYLSVSKRDVPLTDLSAAKRPMPGPRERLA
jgi:uncharacterized membrane-anchored protein